MKAHNGMRPQDIVVLLKILTFEKEDWQYRDLSSRLFISTGEISESLNRSFIAGLLDESRKRVYRQSLMEFITYGLHYVFPAEPGTMVTGMPTAHSHPFYIGHFKSEFKYAWPHENGIIRGLAITPLHPGVPGAATLDQLLYKMLASVDVLRVGRVREKQLAIKELTKIILP